MINETQKYIKTEFGELGIVQVCISRPEALNALNKALIAELKIVLDELSTNPLVRVIILKGDGPKAFVAGADIAEMQKMARDQAIEFARLGHALCYTLENMPKVTIAAVHGFALGGGLELALACDFILASEKAQFGLPEVSLGVIPGFGGTIRLSRVIGLTKAKELIFSGVRIKAEEAKAAGLIRQVYPEEGFFDSVMGVAKKIAANSLDAVLSAKRLLNEFSEPNGVSVKTDAEIHQFGSLFHAPDQLEGMNAFLEKRAPKFKGLEN